MRLSDTSTNPQGQTSDLRLLMEKANKLEKLLEGLEHYETDFSGNNSRQRKVKYSINGGINKTGWVDVDAAAAASSGAWATTGNCSIYCGGVLVTITGTATNFFRVDLVNKTAEYVAAMVVPMPSQYEYFDRTKLYGDLHLTGAMA